MVDDQEALTLRWNGIGNNRLSIESLDQRLGWSRQLRCGPQYKEVINVV